MLRFFIFKKSLVVSVFISLLIFGLSCSKKEVSNEKLILSEDTISEITEEMWDLLIKTSDGLCWIATLKQNESVYIDLDTPVSKFESITDRKKMLMRFGMLTAIIAYEKIIGGKTQTPEYDRLYQKYITELNISPYVNKSFEEYLEKLTENNLTQDLLNEIHHKLQHEKKELINKVKTLDEEFLIYSSLGLLNELSYISFVLMDAENDDLYENEFIQYIGGDDDISSDWQFMNELAKTKGYSEYASILKEATEILLQKTVTDDPYKYTPEEVKLQWNSVVKLRNKILK